MFDYISSIAAVIALGICSVLTVVIKMLPVALFILFFTPVGHLFIAFCVIGFICKQIEN